ncbi:hypothetical protein [Bifidobacterium animalis]|uniref:hypothetical protein n=1 Tax=Bifidobacterium animalis TaxID=28025 RepID=UPI00117A2347|nr:hypothetical protein [Bifidobacterium animalis]
MSNVLRRLVESSSNIFIKFHYLFDICCCGGAEQRMAAVLQHEINVRECAGDGIMQFFGGFQHLQSHLCYCLLLPLQVMDESTQRSAEQGG